jgi:low affinity Fe/Cu permease
MKTFIVTIAAVILLMVFPLQNVQDIVNSHKIERFDEIVYSSCQKARTDGRFTEANISQLKSDILAEFPDVNEDEIIIEVTTSMKYKRFEFDAREAINYKIGIPIKRVVNLGKFLGIKDENNRTSYIMEGYVLSEAVE